MDFSDQYNTKLSPEDEIAFQKWAEAQGKMKDLQDYDLRGMFQQKDALAADGHGPDTYKKPNHPTFSDQSMYNGANGMEGGHWSQDSFEASPMNTIMHSPEALQQYFDRVEPSTQLRFQSLQSKLRGGHG